MGSLYVVELADVLTDAGVRVVVESVNAGWETRARSSGGYDGYPIGVVYHHTASSTSPQNDLQYMIHGSDDEPIGNVLLARDGSVWPIAAGAANTQGKGGPLSFSRGTVPVDSGNSRLFAIEAQNNGVGQEWPQAQIDAYFATSNALNAMFGNLPTDLCTHREWAPDRKADPARADAVQGPWRPRGFTSSDIWEGDDIRAEAQRRAGQQPQPPEPQPPGDDDMASSILIIEDANPPGAWYRSDGVIKTWIADGHMSEQVNLRIDESESGTKPAIDGFVYRYIKNGNQDFIASCGVIVGPRPEGHDEYGRH